MRKRFLAAMAAAMIGMSAMPALASSEEAETTESAEETGSETDRISEIEKLIQEFEEKIAELKIELRELRGSDLVEEGDVIYQDDMVILTYAGIEERSYGYDIKVDVNNLSGKALYVQTDDASINDYMVYSQLASGRVEAGKKCKAVINVNGEYADDYPLDKLEKYEAKVQILDADTYVEEVLSDPITLYFK